MFLEELLDLHPLAVVADATAPRAHRDHGLEAPHAPQDPEALGYNQRAERDNERGFDDRFLGTEGRWRGAKEITRHVPQLVDPHGRDDDEKTDDLGHHKMARHAIRLHHDPPFFNAKTASELPTDRPAGLSDDVLTSETIPVTGSASAKDVEPPPSMLSAFQTSY